MSVRSSHATMEHNYKYQLSMTPHSALNDYVKIVAMMDELALDRYVKHRAIYGASQGAGCE